VEVVSVSPVVVAEPPYGVVPEEPSVGLVVAIVIDAVALFHSCSSS
jgi:hypothetical protein